MADLCARYGVSRQSMTTRLRSSPVVPLKRGHTNVFLPDHVEELDRQHTLLSQGFSLADVASMATDKQVSGEVIDIHTTVAPQPSAQDGFQLLADAIASAVKQASSDNQATDNHLSVHRQLQEISDHGWMVPTRVLARVLGQSNSSLHSWGEKTERLGFSIERTGSRGMFRVIQPQEPTPSPSARSEPTGGTAESDAHPDGEAAL